MAMLPGRVQVVVVQMTKIGLGQIVDAQLGELALVVLDSEFHIDRDSTGPRAYSISASASAVSQSGHQ